MVQGERFLEKASHFSAPTFKRYMFLLAQGFRDHELYLQKNQRHFTREEGGSEQFYLIDEIPPSSFKEGDYSIQNVLFFADIETYIVLFDRGKMRSVSKYYLP